MRQPGIPSLCAIEGVRGSSERTPPPSLFYLGTIRPQRPLAGEGEKGKHKNKTSLGPDSGNGPAHFNGYKARLVLAVRTVHSGEPWTSPVTGCCVNVNGANPGNNREVQGEQNTRQSCLFPHTAAMSPGLHSLEHDTELRHSAS